MERSEPESDRILGASRIVTVFRSRLRPDVDEEYARLAEEIEQLARLAPGFVDFKTFRADDGERVSIIVFATTATHEAWRDDARHREAQHIGRSRLYSEYSITVCEELYERRFPRPSSDEAGVP